MVDTPFPVSPELTAVAIRFSNPSVNLIADDVMPRIAPLGVKNFKYQQYALADGFTVPDLQVGRRGQPREVEIASTEVDSSCLDYGLDDVIPQDDIDQAAAAPSYGGFQVDPLAVGTEYLTDLLLLAREIRVAGLVFGAANYGANTVMLAGNSQWSDFVNSNPIDAIAQGLDSTIGYRPNVLCFGQATWTKIRQHPRVVKAVLGNAGDSGMVTRQQVADLFEVGKVVVGAAFVNSAKKGQAAALSRVWGKHASAMYVNPQASNTRGVTFGFTAQYGTRIAGSLPEPRVGLRGGQRVRVGESVRELIAANQVGYFWQNAVA